MNLAISGPAVIAIELLPLVILTKFNFSLYNKVYILSNKYVDNMIFQHIKYIKIKICKIGSKDYKYEDNKWKQKFIPKFLEALHRFLQLKNVFQPQTIFLLVYL